MAKYDDIARLVREETNGEYEFIEVDKTVKRSSKSTLRLRHVQCGGVFETTAYHFFHRGQRCCSATKKLTHEQFAQRVADRYGPGVYQILGTYVNKETPLEVEHQCGHRFLARPGNLMQGVAGCKRCSGLAKQSIDVIRARVRDKVGDEYEVGDDLVNVSTPMTFRHAACGTTFKMRPTDFLNFDQRCPLCQRVSRGEERIEKWLTEQGLQHHREVRLKDCRDKQPLPFDFLVEISDDLTAFIEFDGRQHYQADGRHTERMLRATQRRDQIRNEYCLRNGYLLLRIPYFHLDDVEFILEHFVASFQERSTTSAWHVEYKRLVLETGGTLLRGEDIVSSLRIYEGRAAA
jgi:very-short-patch-repair endonuclease